MKGTAVSNARATNRWLSALLATGLLLGATACAPEPGDSVAGQSEKGAESANPESSWSEPTSEFDAEAKSTELPAGFPSEEFPLPPGAVIDDAGARSETTWFVVLRAADEAEAKLRWDEIVSLGNLVESDRVETAEGGIAATLTGAGLVITAVTVPQSDGAVLLSFDLASRGD